MRIVCLRKNRALRFAFNSTNTALIRYQPTGFIHTKFWRTQPLAHPKEIRDYSSNNNQTPSKQNRTEVIKFYTHRPLDCCSAVFTLSLSVQYILKLLSSIKHSVLTTHHKHCAWYVCEYHTSWYCFRLKKMMMMMKKRRNESNQHNVLERMQHAKHKLS